MSRVCLDAGHFGKYNQSPCNNKYYESEVMFKLCNYLKKELELIGIDVLTTRDNINENINVYTRGKMAKGCDLFISLHSNAVSKVDEKVDYPVAIVPSDGKSDDIGMKLAKEVCQVMGTYQEARIMTRQKNNKEYYGVLRGCCDVNVKGIILEHSFHTNTRSTKWLMDEWNLEELAKWEADCISKYLECNSSDKDPYLVKVEIDDLNIREGCGIEFGSKGYTGKGMFTIVDEIGNWGLLKSYENKRDGWISLNYTKKYSLK